MKIRDCLILLFVGTLLVSCGRKVNLTPSSVVGLWQAKTGTPTKLLLRANGTFSLISLPEYVLYGLSDTSQHMISTNGYWTLTKHDNSEDADGYINLFSDSHHLYPVTTIIIASDDKTCYFGLGDPDEKLGYQLEMRSAP